MYFISTSLMSYLGLLETSTKIVFLARQPNVAYIIYICIKKSDSHWGIAFLCLIC